METYFSSSENLSSRKGASWESETKYEPPIYYFIRAIANYARMPELHLLLGTAFLNYRPIDSRSSFCTATLGMFFCYCFI